MQTGVHTRMKQHAQRSSHRTNCSILKKLFISPSFLEGASELNTATADSNSFPPFPPCTSTARPKAVDRITSIVILLYSLKLLCVYRCEGVCEVKGKCKWTYLQAIRLHTHTGPDLKCANFKWEYIGVGLNQKIFCFSTFHHSPSTHINNLTFKHAALFDCPHSLSPVLLFNLSNLSISKQSIQWYFLGTYIVQHP